MKQIGIVDYGLGNLFSVEHALQKAGGSVRIISTAKEFAEVDALVLPGVGAFGEAMHELEKRELVKPLQTWINANKPLLGICLGLQLLLEESEEFGVSKGLGLVKGRVVKFPSQKDGKQIRVPHMGWNISNPSMANHPSFKSVNTELEMYFVHSYYVQLADKTQELSWTEYEGIRYTSSVSFRNTWAFQFHPEKSGENGIKIYENWIRQFS